jgi:hypothetical protein
MVALMNGRSIAILEVHNNEKLTASSSDIQLMGGDKLNMSLLMWFKIMLHIAARSIKYPHYQVGDNTFMGED